MIIFFLVAYSIHEDEMAHFGSCFRLFESVGHFLFVESMVVDGESSCCSTRYGTVVLGQSRAF